jgi:hypothetical protein
MKQYQWIILILLILKIIHEIASSEKKANKKIVKDMKTFIISRFITAELPNILLGFVSLNDFFSIDKFEKSNVGKNIIVLIGFYIYNVHIKHLISC